MKYSERTIRVLISLRDGETLSASAVKGKQLESIVSFLVSKSAVHFNRTSKSRGVYTSTSRESFVEACADYDPVLSDLEDAMMLTQGEFSSRAEKVAAFGDSKTGSIDKTVKGFTILADRNLTVRYLEEDFTIGPETGLHVIKRQSLTIPSDATVIVVENTECFYDLRWIPNVGLDRNDGPYIIMSRFPVSENSKLFLEGIPNRVLYFGDFDLAGVNIYETEYKRRLGERVRFIVPADIEARIRSKGNPSLYSKQLNSNVSRTVSQSSELDSLVSLLNRLQSCYEQEGYCLEDNINTNSVK